VTGARPVTMGRVLSLALPAAAASAATPLLGVVDAFALGRSPDPLEVGAVGLAAAVFSALYWTFGFLRMATAGLSAQAAGAGDEPAARALLARSAGLGALVGAALLLLGPLLKAPIFAAMAAGSEASADTFAAAQTYFEIRLWAAPAALATYAVTGWLTGRGRTGVVLAATALMTGLNGALDWLFVVRMGMGAEGVALGTAIAEASGFLFTGGGALYVLARSGGLERDWGRAFKQDRAAFAKLFQANRDIFIRTALLVTAFVFFTQRSGARGDVTLAANQILLQLFLLTGLALDGPAIAAESLVGAAVGRGDRAMFGKTVRLTSIATGLAAVPFAAAYALFGDAILGAMTSAPEIAAEARRFLPWLAMSPLAVALAFELDGIFVGASRGRDMRDMMVLSFALYLAAWALLTRWFGAHGHWAAFLLYFAIRGATLLFRMPRIGREVFSERPAA